MRKWLYLFPLLFVLQSTAQTPGYCKDSLNVDTWYQCGLGNGYQYDPVCGCDGITYRNSCAAEHWGGLYYGAWVSNTICGNFHFDFRPTAIQYDGIAYFQAYIRNVSNVNIPVTLYVYDIFGKLEYTWYGATSTDGLYPLQPLELPLQSLRMGIYILMVVIDNEKQTVKFGKVTPDIE